MIDLYMRQQYGIHSDTGDLYEGFNSGYSDEERVDARHLQGSKELTTLTLTFTRCLFVVSEHICIVCSIVLFLTKLVCRATNSMRAQILEWSIV
jgi:hypothetical protein